MSVLRYTAVSHTGMHRHADQISPGVWFLATPQALTSYSNLGLDKRLVAKLRAVLGAAYLELGAAGLANVLQEGGEDVIACAEGLKQVGLACVKQAGAASCCY